MNDGSSMNKGEPQERVRTSGGYTPPQRGTDTNSPNRPVNTRKPSNLVRQNRDEQENSRKQERPGEVNERYIKFYRKYPNIWHKIEQIEACLREQANEIEELRCNQPEFNESNNQSTYSTSTIDKQNSSENQQEDIDALKKLVKKQSAEILRLKEQVLIMGKAIDDGPAHVLDTTLQPYVELGVAIQLCESTKGILDGYLPLENKKNIVLFVGLIGYERTFANIIYNSIKKFKSVNKLELTAEECSLIALLNSFYRKRDELEYDVFVVPEENGKFNKLHMQDLDRPSNNAFRQYTDVYVPIIMKDEKNVQFRGIVKGKS